MIVHDIIQVVSPSAKSSIPPGEYWVESYDELRISEQRAQMYNRFASDGFCYSVESIEETAENRKLPRK